MLLLLTASCVLKANKYSGRVFDKTTGEPLPFTHIFDQKGCFLTLSDNNGKFIIEIAGTDSIRIIATSVGYEKYSMSFSRSARELLLALSPLTHQLNDVEVEGVRSAININRPYAQNTVYAAKIEENISSSLIDVLETVPGLYKKSEYHSPIVLRGLSGKRVLVTEDGNRKMGSTSSGFSGQTVNVYNLEKVEVIKGPASVRYGPGAIGGIINMVSRQPFAQQGFNGRVLGVYGTNNNEYTVLGNLNYCNESNSLSIGGRYQHASDFHYGNGAKAENSFHKDADVNAMYIHRFRNNLSVAVNGNVHLGGPWGRPKGYNGTEYVVQTAERDDSYYINAGVKWSGERIPLTIDAAVFYDKDRLKEVRSDYDIGSGRLSFQETVDYDNYYSGWKLHALYQVKDNIQLMLGSDGIFYRVKSPTVMQDFFKNYIIRNKVADNSGVVMGGLFLESEVNFCGDKLKWVVGVRGDLAKMNEGNVHDTLLVKGRSPHLKIINANTGLMYQFIRDLFLSVNIARASRMPDAKELFVESSTTDGMVYGNPALKPEYGFNFDLGVKGYFSDFIFDISLYANFLHDFITPVMWYGANKKGNNYKYDNIDKSLIYGAEISLAYNRNGIFTDRDAFNYNGFAVITKGYEIKKDHNWLNKDRIPLNQIPPFNTRHEIIYRYRFGGKLSVYAGMNLLWFNGRKEYASTSYPTGSYCLIGCLAGVQKRIQNVKYRLSVNISNLTNEAYKPFESLIYGMGRNIKFLFSVEFGESNRRYRTNCINE